MEQSDRDRQKHRGRNREKNGTDGTYFVTNSSPNLIRERIAVGAV